MLHERVDLAIVEAQPLDAGEAHHLGRTAAEGAGDIEGIARVRAEGEAVVGSQTGEDSDIGAGPALKAVVSTGACQHIVPAKAQDHIRARTAGQRVAALRAGDCRGRIGGIRVEQEADLGHLSERCDERFVVEEDAVFGQAHALGDVGPDIGDVAPLAGHIVEAETVIDDLEACDPLAAGEEADLDAGAEIVVRARARKALGV
ncbi:MAG: hypothetical protein AAFU70_04110, partial [Planctomycetota bacterium]